MTEKYEMLVKSLNELLQDKDELLLRGYDISGLLGSLKKANKEA